MTLHGWFNLIEGVFWITVSQIILVKQMGTRFLRGLAAGVLVLFGISDFFEIGTGAWWRPVELLIFKGTCLAVIVVTCFLGMSQRRSPDRESIPPQQSDD